MTALSFPFKTIKNSHLEFEAGIYIKRPPPPPPLPPRLSNPLDHQKIKNKHPGRSLEEIRYVNKVSNEQWSYHISENVHKTSKERFPYSVLLCCTFNRYALSNNTQNKWVHTELKTGKQNSQPFKVQVPKLHLSLVDFTWVSTCPLAGEKSDAWSRVLMFHMVFNSQLSFDTHYIFIAVFTICCE